MARVGGQRSHIFLVVSFIEAFVKSNLAVSHYAQSDCEMLRAGVLVALCIQKIRV